MECCDCEVPSVIAFQALAVGILVGVTFGFTRMPVPAPATIAGLMGVIGITAGWKVALWIIERVG